MIAFSWGQCRPHMQIIVDINLHVPYVHVVTMRHSNCIALQVQASLGAPRGVHNKVTTPSPSPTTSPKCTCTRYPLCGISNTYTLYTIPYTVYPIPYAHIIYPPPYVYPMYTLTPIPILCTPYPISLTM